MTTRATLPQARLLMHLWVDDRQGVPHIAGSNPTFDVLVRQGWVADTGATYTFSSGKVAPTYRITKTGLIAAAETILKDASPPAEQEQK